MLLIKEGKRQDERPSFSFLFLSLHFFLARAVSVFWPFSNGLSARKLYAGNYMIETGVLVLFGLNARLWGGWSLHRSCCPYGRNDQYF